MDNLILLETDLVCLSESVLARPPLVQPSTGWASVYDRQIVPSSTSVTSHGLQTAYLAPASTPVRTDKEHLNPGEGRFLVV